MRRIKEVFSEEINEISKDTNLAPDILEEVMAHIYSKDHGATRLGEPIICDCVPCENCKFDQEEDCIGATYDWLMEEI